MYKLKLSNGRELSEVKQNGVMLSTTEAITREELERGLGHVVITGEPDVEVAEGEAARERDYSGEYAGMKLQYFSDSGAKREFVIAPMSSEELSSERMRADLEYLAMMSGIQL